MQSDNHVFINCPFDRQYRSMFDAIIFAVLDCGFVARCALEVDDGGQVRIDKIVSIIRECRLGIHDISRTEPDPTTGLPRFNMPSELGLFLGAKRFGVGPQRRKLSLILDRERYRYQASCSDIAGQDVSAHDGSAIVAVKIVPRLAPERLDDFGRVDPQRGGRGRSFRAIPPRPPQALRQDKARRGRPNLQRLHHARGLLDQPKSLIVPGPIRAIEAIFRVPGPAAPVIIRRTPSRPGRMNSGSNQGNAP